MNILLRIIHSSVFKSLLSLGLLLFLLTATFSIKKEAKGYLSEKKSVHSTFYVAGPSPLNNQKDIPLWASFYSPAIFIRANSPMNYSYNFLTVNQKLEKFVDKRDDTYKITNRTLAERNFMKRHFSLAQVLYDNHQSYPIGKAKLKEKEFVKQKRLYFRTISGLTIPALPSFQKFKITPIVQRTVLGIRGLDTNMPTVSLKKSSTSNGLDQKALTALKQALLKTKVRKALYEVIQSSEGVLELDWRMN